MALIVFIYHGVTRSSSPPTTAPLTKPAPAPPSLAIEPPTAHQQHLLLMLLRCRLRLLLGNERLRYNHLLLEKANFLDVSY